MWINGRFVRSSLAGLHVLSHGLHYGTSVFEGERAYDGQVFKLSEHSARLRQSAELIGFDIPFSTKDLDEATDELVRLNRDPDAYVRPIAWRGSGDMGVHGPNAGVHVAIGTWSWPNVFDTQAAERGISLVVSPWRRPRPDQAPIQAKAAANYLTGAISRSAAARQGADDALMLDADGWVAEVTGANIFIVSAGETIVTPPAISCLNGITRRTVASLAHTLGLAVEERPISRDELFGAREVFLTGTAYEVQPVHRIDDIVFSAGTITRRIAATYRDLVHSRPTAPVPSTLLFAWKE